jgi:hypothetical protein
MRRILTFAGLPLVAALALGGAVFGEAANGNDNRNGNSAAAHAAAVQRCKDTYQAALAQAKKISDRKAQTDALAKARRDYDACKKSADTARY